MLISDKLGREQVTYKFHSILNSAGFWLIMLSSYDGKRVYRRMKQIMDLFLTFGRIGALMFGGGYAMLSLLDYECVEKKKWLTADELMDVTVIAESTPGPSLFLILLAVTILFHNFLKHKKVQAVLKGVKPCLMGGILATGIYMEVSICIPSGVSSHLAGTQGIGSVFLTIDPTACILLSVLGLITVLYQAVRKKDFPPAALLSLAGGSGVHFLFMTGEGQLKDKLLINFIAS